MMPQALVRSIWPVMTVLFLAELVSSLEASMLYTALPTIAAEYGDLSRVTWLLTGYILVHACSAVLGSRLGDMYGRRRALIAVLLLCACGSLVSALSKDLSWIIAGRMIQGATGAILPLAFGICREVTTPQRTPFWIGILTGAWAGSAAFGYVLGGLFAETGHWQSLFWLTAILPVVVALLATKMIPADAPPQGGRLDIAGAVLIVPAISLCLLAITQSSKLGWLHPLPLGQLSAGLAILAIWVVVELRSASPLVDVRQLANRQVALANLSYAMLGLGGMHLALVLMLLLQQPLATGIGFGLGATMAGLLKLPSNLISFVASPVSGWLAGRRGARVPLMIGAAFMAAAWVGMMVGNTALWHIMVGAIAATMGASMIQAAVANLILEVAPKSRSSEATGLSIVVRGVFAAIGAQIIGVLLASSKGAGSAYPDHGAYMVIMGYIAATSIAIVVIGLLLPRRPGVDPSTARPVSRARSEGGLSAQPAQGR